MLYIRCQDHEDEALEGVYMLCETSAKAGSEN